MLVSELNEIESGKRLTDIVREGFGAPKGAGRVIGINATLQ
jgi:hypothetical protein